jgi:hypothetical protein
LICFVSTPATNPTIIAIDVMMKPIENVQMKYRGSIYSSAKIDIAAQRSNRKVEMMA